ncbi:ABC transporter ATP-binding protein [Mycolicibacterium palauense]|uniref:ABC transporter ATP-binding protein n=1 Tax=Mycolicibacterium palauense TaxID=2034511 RepID=UPI000BFED19B|nr:ABC transporter ATP-binding protein [Mycolicibacterium palauense]
MTVHMETPASTSRAKFLDLEGISIDYGTTPAVKDIDLQIGEGEFVSIIGPSGCGKSTLLHVLAGLKAPRSGRITYRNSDVTADVRRQLRTGYVFQDHRLLPWRSVRRNIEIAMRSAAIPKEQWAGQVERYLNLLHVGDHAEALPMNLSGGQRQRVSIARALAVRPDLVLMDEPFSGLDEVTGRIIRTELDRMRIDSGTPTLFVTHSIREALYLSDRILVFSRGPATVLREVVVPLPRPRSYGDPRLAQLEEDLVAEVLKVWEPGGTSGS